MACYLLDIHQEVKEHSLSSYLVGHWHSTMSSFSPSQYANQRWVTTRPLKHLLIKAFAAFKRCAEGMQPGTNWQYTMHA